MAVATRLRQWKKKLDRRWVGVYFFQALLRGSLIERGGRLKEREGLFNLATGARFLEDGLVVPGRYTALTNDKKMVTILHRELDRKVEKVQHMKLEVMRLKTKNNMNFQPE